MNMNNKHSRRVVAIISLVIILAMVVTAVVPAMVG